jgi:hypothetical protein
MPHTDPAKPPAKTADAKPVVDALSGEAAGRKPGMVPVRLSIHPDDDHWVMPHELEQLRHQGLLIENDAPSGATAKVPASGAGKDAP